MKKREAEQINACCASLFPAFAEDANNKDKDSKFKVPLEEKVETPLDEDDEPLKPSKRVTASGLWDCSLRQSRFGQLL